jgi:hypothetical protein
MILSTHFIAGAAVAAQTDNPVAIVTIPIILHFALDALPHWQYAEDVEEMKKKKLQIFLDLVLGPIIILLVVFFQGLDLQRLAWLFAAGVVCNIPDGLIIVHLLAPKNRILKKIYDFHCWIQPKKHLNFWVGFPIQAAIDIAAIILIILPKM